MTVSIDPPKDDTLHTTFQKPARGTAKRERQERRAKAATAERKAKDAAKKRDGRRCRFPLCGCKKMRFAIEASHQQHKGMGGNPTGDRSTTEGLITLCTWRHRAGQFAVDRGNVKWEPRTERGADGPVTWYLSTSKGWELLAIESAVQVLEPLLRDQKTALRALATMEL